jgi:Fungal Zn(2)-Cys(6) binuclear cluster domain
MDHLGSESRKRPRPVVSCLRCRDKKLKCDRLLPCESCTKAGCTSQCKYTDHQSNKSARTSPALLTPQSPVAVNKKHDGNHPSSGLGLIEDLRLRVSKLEEMLALSTPSLVGAAASPRLNVSGATSTGNVFGTLIVKGTRSRYHGQNDKITLLRQVCNKDSSF